MFFKSVVYVVIWALLTQCNCNTDNFNMAVGEDEKPIEIFLDEIETESEAELEIAEISEEYPESEIDTDLIEPENQCFNEERVNLQPKRIVRRARPTCGCVKPKYEYLENDYLSPDFDFVQPKILRKRPQYIVKRAVKPSTRVVYLKKRSESSCERKVPVVTGSCKMEKTASDVKPSKSSESKVEEESPIQEKEEISEPSEPVVETEQKFAAAKPKKLETVKKAEVSAKKSKPTKSSKKPKKQQKKVAKK